MPQLPEQIIITCPEYKCLTYYANINWYWTAYSRENFFLDLQAASNLLITLNEPSSRIRGHVLKSYRGLDYNAFQDIPYAAPPIGENRFAVSHDISFRPNSKDFIGRCHTEE